MYFEHWKELAVEVGELVVYELCLGVFERGRTGEEEALTQFPSLWLFGVA